MTGVTGRRRRVLLGVSEDRQLRPVVEAAATLASGLKAGLQCLVVEHEDLIAVAGLPFARAFGLAGVSRPVTIEAMENHFRNLARAVERELAASCMHTQVQWALTRPQGDYLRELLAAAETDDVIVMSREAVLALPGGALAAVARLLGRVSAVVLTSGRPLRDGSVMALTADGPGGESALARDIAEAIGARVEPMTLQAFLLSRRQAAVVVVEAALAEAAGERAFFKRVDEAGAAVVLV